MTQTYIIINALLYFSLLFFYLKKVRTFNIGVFVLSLWSLSALASIHYSTTGIYKWNNSITLFPFIYLFILFWIYIQPMLKFRNEQIKTIWSSDKAVNIMAIVLSIIAIIPFIENLVQAIKVGSGISGSAVVELIESRYGDESYDQFYYLSAIGRKLNWINNAFVMLSMAFFFYLLTKAKRNKFVIIGLLCSITSSFLQAFSLSARFQLVKNLLIFLFFYLVFNNLLEEKLRKKIKKIIFITVAVIFLGTMIVSVYRYAGMTETRTDISYSMLDWLSLYLSEGFLNFNGDMWHIEDYCYGMNTAYMQRYFLGLSDDLFYRDYFKLEEITHIRMNVFYTMIGDLYSDFGPFGTIFVVSITSLIFRSICKVKKHIALSKILILSLVAKVSLIGFTYYTFVGDAIQIFIMPIVAFYLHIKEQKNKS